MLPSGKGPRPDRFSGRRGRAASQEPLSAPGWTTVIRKGRLPLLAIADISALDPKNPYDSPHFFPEANKLLRPNHVRQDVKPFLRLHAFKELTNIVLRKHMRASEEIPQSRDDKPRLG